MDPEAVPLEASTCLHEGSEEFNVSNIERIELSS
jgi:hypothetical protein